MPFSAPPDLQSTHRVQHHKGVTLVVHRDWCAHLSVEALQAGAPLEQWGQPVLNHGLVGRAQLHVLDTPGGQLVAKALSRGGLLGGVLPGLYMDSWRPVREAALAESLKAQGVPTATVVVARSARATAGLYRCEIATARLPGTVDLLDALVSRPVAEWTELAGAVGRTLGRLHEVGLVHRDMQVKNLLVGAGFERQDSLLPVIDLDGCEMVGQLGRRERLAALARFARSLVKRGLLPGRRGIAIALPGQALRAFMKAYVSTQPELWMGGRSLLLRRLSRELSRQVAIHGLFWRESGLHDQGPRGR
ncbi:MAG: hypothetical protein ACI9EF_002290 [Pseudohongiellaceae bacterium]|jgi:hypothetical protein